MDHQIFKLGWQVGAYKGCSTIYPSFYAFSTPCTKRSLTTIQNHAKRLRYGKGEKKKKWALVAWENIYKPKNQGGLGLDDPEVLSRALGAKL